LIETIYFTRWRFDSPVWGTVMARRAFYEKAGLFDHRFSFFSDVDMWLRLAEDYDVAYVREPLITLAGRKAVPTMINVPNMDVLIRRMFWEARMRHYRLNPIRRMFEAARHFSFALFFKIYRFLGVAKALMFATKPKPFARPNAHGE